MKIKKKLIIFAISFVMMISLFPIINAKAANSDIKIISETKVTEKQAKKWAKSKGATETFINLADLYYKYSSEHGNINPALAYVQAAKETGYGKFGGVLDESYHNPCGLKTAIGGSDNDKKAHKKFDNWDQGVQAHLDHLALYAGASGYPRENTYDERHFRTIKGTAPSVNLLGGKWAPSSTYGEEVNQLYNDLLSYSGIKNADDVKIKNTNSDTNTSSSANANKNTNKNSNTNSDNDKSVPDPTVSETKPSAPKVSDVIKVSNSSEDNKKSNVTSTNTGWKSENGKWYYFSKPGVMEKGWIKLNNIIYFLQGDGSMVTGLKSIDNKTYFFDNSGSMVIGWQQIDNHWYYFNLDGTMSKGWIIDNRSTYYLYDTGAMAKGWINLDGTWYYLKNSGAMAVGWIKYNNNWYYLNPSTGKMTKKSSKHSSSDMIITIDPGHDYNKDGGASATVNGVTYSEVDLNLQTAIKLRDVLEKKGYNVVMTRDEGERPDYGSLTDSLAHRVDIANNSNSDLFISIHHNTASVTAKGVETFYSVFPKDAEYGGDLDTGRLEKSKEIAQAICDSIANKIGTNNRGAKADASSNVGKLFVLKNTEMPAVLIEVGFISNPEEAARCASQDGQQKVAEAIADAIAVNLA